MQKWESLIGERILAHRDTYRPQTVEDAVERNEKAVRKAYAKKYNARPEVKARNAEREKSPERKAQKKAWNASEKGRASMARRGRKYVESHRVAIRAKARRYYDAHKNDPAWMEKKRAYSRAWSAAHSDRYKAYRAANLEKIRATQRRCRTYRRLPSGTVYAETHRIYLLGMGWTDVRIVREVA